MLQIAKRSAAWARRRTALCVGPYRYRVQRLGLEPPCPRVPLAFRRAADADPAHPSLNRRHADSQPPTVKSASFDYLPERSFDLAEKIVFLPTGRQNARDEVCPAKN